MGFVERSTWLRLLNPQTHCEMLTFFPTFPQTASLLSGQAGSITARTPCANGAKRVAFSRRGKKCSACKFSVVRFQARSGSSRQSFQWTVFSRATAEAQRGGGRKIQKNVCLGYYSRAKTMWAGRPRSLRALSRFRSRWVGADRRDAPNFRRAAPFHALPQRRPGCGGEVESGPRMGTEKGSRANTCHRALAG